MSELNSSSCVWNEEVCGKRAEDGVHAQRGSEQRGS